MARIPSGSMGSTSGSSRNPDAPSVSVFRGEIPSEHWAEIGNTGHGISQPSSLSALLIKIKSSNVYKQAFEIFSNSSNPDYWLTQLQAILDSITMPDSTFLDEINWSQRYDDKVAAIYNEAISSISQLLSQYQQHINSLPSTAVQQDSVAGINSAITGQVRGSEFVGEGTINSEAYMLEGTNVGEFMLNAASGLLSTLSGFADVVHKFGSLGLEKSKVNIDSTRSFNEFKRVLSDAGVIIKSSSWDELDKHDPTWAASAPARAKSLYNAYQEIVSGKTYGPVVSAGISEGYTDEHIIPLGVDGSPYGSYMVGSTFFGNLLTNEYADLGVMQLRLSVAEARHNAKIRDKRVTNAMTPEDVQYYQDELTKADAEFQEEKAKIFLERVQTLKERIDNGDPIASVQMINLMQNADWQESLVYVLSEKGYDLMSKHEAFSGLFDFLRIKR